MAWRDKAERLVNLFILLLSARNFVTRAHIRETIEGYRDMGDGAFERMFERDKDELRSAGVPIITGSNDPDSDEQDGYMVRRDEFELPPRTVKARDRQLRDHENEIGRREQRQGPIRPVGRKIDEHRSEFGLRLIEEVHQRIAVERL